MGRVICILILAALCACSSDRHGSRLNSAYYWSTTLDLDSTKLAFMKEHDVKRLYVRFFDIMPDDGGNPMPNATLRFNTAVPKDIEVVPTVFIVNDCMRRNTDGLAEKTLKRIMRMCETNDIGNVREVQIDCDWTLGTQRVFYKFADLMRRLCHEHGLKLSLTIRLHQLSQSPPPADRGVLMVYNTGDFTRLDCRKPILDINDVKPYLRYLHDYHLPLSGAYPVYSWRILFRAGRYVGIMHRDDDLPVLQGDSIVTRQPELDDIMNARQAIDSRREDTGRETIIFDLSNLNINRFKSAEYEEIFNSRYGDRNSLR